MTADIINGIKNAIINEFGENYTVYTGPVDPEVSKPCFSVLCENPTKELYLGRKYIVKNPFCIQYLPSATGAYEECIPVMEKLYTCLEIITMGDDLIRGGKMESECKDNLLSFHINYDLFVYEMEEQENMDGMDFNAAVKG